MIEEFEPNQYDSRISSIIFTRENDLLFMKIVGHTKEKSVELEALILGARRIYDMAPPKDLNLTTKQNFELECDETRSTLTLSGNLYNAFSLLKQRSLISADFAEKILKHEKIAEALQSTKNFVIQIESEESEESPRTTLERALSSHKEYVAALLALEKDELRQMLSQLAHDLGDKAKDLLEVKKNDSQNNSPKVH